MTLRDRVRAAIEQMLPWYDPEIEEQRERRSQRIHRFSIAARKSAERELTPEERQLIQTVRGTVKALRHGR
jgi:hypothetical protein